MVNTPTISVVMSVYNEEKYVRSAVRSILDQTFGDFEFIIIDDGSTDATSSILNTFAQADSRIRLIRNEHNVGLTKSLNLGLDSAQGKFIARMDADDIALTKRFENQIRVFSEQPDTILCGTATIHIDENGRCKSVGEWPEDPRIGKWYSVFRPALAHPSAMFRCEVLNQGLRYDETLKIAQDFDLFSRMQPYGDTTVLKAPLLLSRSHGDNISSERRAEQGACAAKICRDNLCRTFPPFFLENGPQAAISVSDFIHSNTSISANELAKAVAIVFRLENEYLRALTPRDKSTTRAIQRLTVRWIVQAVFRKKSLSLTIRLRLLYELRHRLHRIVEESFRYACSRFKARHLIDLKSQVSVGVLSGNG